MATNARCELDTCVRCGVEKELKLLFCLHSLCDRCLVTVEGPETECDLCHVITDPNKHPPKVNFLQAEQLQVAELGEPKPCLYCQSAFDRNVVSSYICYECDGVSLCASCYKSHKKMPVTKSHDPISYEDLGESCDNLSSYLAMKTTSEVCEKHVDKREPKRKDLYCRKCKVVACQICVLEDHEAHRIAALTQIRLEEIDPLKTKTDQLEERQKANINSPPVIEQRKNARSAQAEEILNELDNRIAQVTEAMKHYRELIRTQMTSFHNKRNHLDDRRVEHLEKLREEIKGTLKFATTFQIFATLPEMKEHDCFVESAIGRSLGQCDTGSRKWALAEDEDEVNLSKPTETISKRLLVALLGDLNACSTGVMNVGTLVDNLGGRKLRKVAEWQSENLSHVNGLVVTNDNEVYTFGAAQTGKDQCYEVYSMSGEFIRKVSLTGGPKCQAKLHNESLYVACLLENCVRQYGIKGNVVRTIQLPHTDEESEVFGVEVYGNNIFISHQKKNKIFMCSLDETEATEWKIQDKIEFKEVRDVCVTQDNCLCVVDFSGHTIYKLNMEGELEAKFGTGQAGRGEGQLNSPWGVDIDDSGRIYIADGSGVVVLSKYLTFLGRSFDSNQYDFDHVRRVKISPDQRYIVVNHSDNKILVLETDN